jgi:hypothetical protein
LRIWNALSSAHRGDNRPSKYVEIGNELIDSHVRENEPCVSSKNSVIGNKLIVSLATMPGHRRSVDAVRENELRLLRVRSLRTRRLHCLTSVS